jgi:hypothetical protein
MKKKQGHSHHRTGGDHLACQGNRPELFDFYLCNNGRLGNGNAHRQPRHERWRWLQQIIHRLIFVFSIALPTPSRRPACPSLFWSWRCEQTSKVPTTIGKNVCEQSEQTSKGGIASQKRLRAKSPSYPLLVCSHGFFQTV